MTAFFFSRESVHRCRSSSRRRPRRRRRGALTGGAMERVLWRPLRRRGAGSDPDVHHLDRALALPAPPPARPLRVAAPASTGTTPSSSPSTSARSRSHRGTSSSPCSGPRHPRGRPSCSSARGSARRCGPSPTTATSPSPPGIDVDRVVLVVWLVGGGLAALGGVFYGLTQAVYWDMGFNLLLLMFAGGHPRRPRQRLRRGRRQPRGRARRPAVHAVVPHRAAERLGAAGPHRRPARPPAGHPRPRGAGRMTARGEDE